MPTAVATTIGRMILGQDQRSDPALKHLFIIDSPRLKGAFTKVSGIQETIEVLTQRDGQNPQQVRKTPGTFQGGEIKLERGVVYERRDLVEWFSLVKRCGAGVRSVTGVRGIQKNIRASIDIIAVSCDGDGMIAREARLIRLNDAWPRKYQLADLDAGSSDVAVENLTLTFEELIIEPQFISGTPEPVARSAGRAFGAAIVRGFNSLFGGLSDR